MTAQTVSRVTAKNPTDKLAHKRLSVLQLAESLGNVAEACRRGGMDRTSFYDFKRRFQTHGFEGLKDLPPIPKSHPFTTPEEHVETMLDLAIKNASWGCMRLSDELRLRGITISSPTIQKMLIKRGLGSRYERILRFEEIASQQKIELNAEQIRLLETANPVFRERHVESSRPGELICQDTFYVGHLKGIGKLYLQAVVDTYGSYAFGFLATSKLPACAVSILHNDVLPFYRDRKLPVMAILTDNGREFCGTANHQYELYLELNDIEHRRTKVATPRTNGFVERFNRTILDEFFRTKMRETLYESVEQLQADLDLWLKFYNEERPHRGYRNLGRRPIDTINEFTQPARQEA
jgi:transposase InsO family protein